MIKNQLMHILLTVPTFSPVNTGLANAVLQQAISLAANGYEVIVATSGPVRATEVHPAGFRVERFDVQGRHDLVGGIRGDSGAYLGFLRSVCVDVVVMNAWQNWATDLALQHGDTILGRKVVYSHGLSTNIFFWQQPVRSALRFVMWRSFAWRLPAVLRSLDGFIALADGGCDCRFDDVRLARKLGLPLHVVPNALPAYALQVPPAAPERSARNVIIAVGAFEWLKGHDIVLRAYALSDARRHFPLHVFGQTPTPFLESLKALAVRLKLDNVHFHCGQSGAQLLAYYRQSVVLLSGSRTEAQPLALLDAAATGTPFIANATGCIDTMAGGITVHSVREMARALERVLEPAVWDDLHRQALEAAANRHAPARVADKLMAALDSIMRRGDGARDTT